MRRSSFFFFYLLEKSLPLGKHKNYLIWFMSYLISITMTYRNGNKVIFYEEDFSFKFEMNITSKYQLSVVMGICRRIERDSV